MLYSHILAERGEAGGNEPAIAAEVYTTMQTPKFVGQQLGSFEILSLLGAGGPPPLASALMRELRRGLAEAQQRPRP